MHLNHPNFFLHLELEYPYSRSLNGDECRERHHIVYR